MRYAALICLITALVGPAVASGDAYDKVEAAYASSGTINGCQFSSGELTSALNHAPTYDLEYDADLTDSIQNALSERATGQCSRGGAAAVVSHVRPTGPLARLRPPASSTGATGASIPLPLALAAIMAGLAALLGLGLALGRSRGWDPEWAIAVRHSWTEAEYRVSGAWESFRDWLGN